MLGLDAFHAHVARELVAADQNMLVLLEAQQGEEADGGFDIGDGDRHMIEMLEHRMASSRTAV